MLLGKGVVRSCSENIQQIYRRTPMLKCDFKTLCYGCSVNLLYIQRQSSRDASGLQLYLKRDPGTGVFLWILWITKNALSTEHLGSERLFYKNTYQGFLLFVNINFRIEKPTVQFEHKFSFGQGCLGLVLNKVMCLKNFKSYLPRRSWETPIRFSVIVDSIIC